MSNRALIPATVLLLIGCFAANSADAQNLEAGKSPSQIFAGACSACHKSPRGLLKTVAPSSLPGFLREHYTTSPDMAGLLASYLASNGATDTRLQSRQGQPKQGRDAQQEANRAPGAPDQVGRPGRRHPNAAGEPAPSDAEQAERPDADGLNPQSGRRPGRHAKRPPRPADAPDANPAQTANEPKSGPRPNLSKRGNPAEEIKPADGQPEAAKPEAVKEEAPKDAASKNTTEKVDTPKEMDGSEPASPSATSSPPSAPAPASN